MSDGCHMLMILCFCKCAGEYFCFGPERGAIPSACCNGGKEENTECQHQMIFQELSATSHLPNQLLNAPGVTSSPVHVFSAKAQQLPKKFLPCHIWNKPKEPTPRSPQKDFLWEEHSSIVPPARRPHCDIAAIFLVFPTHYSIMYYLAPTHIIPFLFIIRQTQSAPTFQKCTGLQLIKTTVHFVIPAFLRLQFPQSKRNEKELVLNSFSSSGSAFLRVLQELLEFSDVVKQSKSKYSITSWFF